MNDDKQTLRLKITNHSGCWSWALIGDAWHVTGANGHPIELDAIREARRVAGQIGLKIVLES